MVAAAKDRSGADGIVGAVKAVAIGSEIGAEAGTATGEVREVRVDGIETADDVANPRKKP